MSSLYFASLLPFELLVELLTHNGQVPLQQRELSFEMLTRGSDGRCYYDRFREFNSANEWRAYALSKHSLPRKLDIGGVYNAPMSQKAKTADFRPQGCELRFDIDLSDYNAVRYCCAEKQMCAKCWPLAVVAAEVLSARLRDELGLKSFFWVFSGRRGLHCWVLDEAPFFWDQQTRTEIVQLLNGECKRLEAGGRLSRCVQQLMPTLRRHFSEFLTSQEILTHDDRCRSLIDDLPVPASVAERWLGKKPRSFEALERLLAAARRKDETREQLAARPCLAEEIILQCLYPRLDAGVTESPKHLLKAPFSPHNSTGRVCVPLGLQEVRDFDLERDSPLASDAERVTDQFIAQRSAVVHAAMPWRQTSE